MLFYVITFSKTKNLVLKILWFLTGSFKMKQLTGNFITSCKHNFLKYLHNMYYKRSVHFENND